MKAHNILYVTSHSAYTVVRAERGRQNSETPEPIDRKFTTDFVNDYDITRMPKFNATPYWGVPTNS